MDARGGLLLYHRIPVRFDDVHLGGGREIEPKIVNCGALSCCRLLGNVNDSPYSSGPEGD